MVPRVSDSRVVTRDYYKNKILFDKKQVVNKSTGVIFVLVRLVMLQYSRYIEKAYDEVKIKRSP